MTIRVGPNVHPKARGGADWSAEEKAYFPGFLQQLNPSAMLQMGQGEGTSEFNLALAWRDLLPNTTVIYRHYHGAEGHLFKELTPYDYIKGMKIYTDPRLPLYILNETNSKAPLDELKQNINWRVEVMRILALEGQPHVTGNEGPGQPHMSWFTDDAKWEIVQPFFQQFKINPFASWGLHPYWGSNGLRPSDGQSARHRDIAQALADRDTSMPNVYLTEVGRDRYGDSKVNGWRSTGVTEEVFAEEIVEAQNTLWNEPYIRGAMLFCYGSTTKIWWQFDIMNAGIIHKRLIEANKQAVEIPPPPPTLPPEPTLPIDLGNPVSVRVEGANWVLRAEPRTSAAKIGLLVEGEEIKLYPATAHLSDGHSFKVIERVLSVVSEARRGWTAYPTPIYAPPPLPPETVDTIARIVVVRAKIHAMASLLEDIVNDLHKLEEDLATRKAA